VVKRKKAELVSVEGSKIIFSGFCEKKTDKG
jgi:hypothetical protein